MNNGIEILTNGTVNHNHIHILKAIGKYVMICNRCQEKMGFSLRYRQR